ncbi:MAG: VCBS domain-containing protein, partial [Planctomycetia bacterium]
GSIVSWGRISNNAGTDLIDASTLVPNPLTGVGNFSYSYSYSGRGNTTYPASSTAPTNAGSYTLAVTSTDPNYSGGKTVDFVIAKATPTITTLPQASIIAEGQALSVAVLDGGLASIPGVFTFSTPAFVPSAGTTVQSITFTPTDSVNYENVTTSINVLAQGAQATVPTILSVPTATPITFGQRLQLSTLSGGSASVPGTFVYSSRLTVPNPGTASQSVTFIPNDIATYAAVTFAVPLTVYDGITSPVSVPLIPPPSFVYDGVAKPFQISRSQFLSSGRDHTLILNSDGTVTAIGSNSMGECNVPAGLTGVVAVSAALGSSMALKSDGTVVEWGYLIGAAPSGLSGVVAISRADHTLALKSDGTVVAWGYNGTGQCNVPSGLSNVVAVAAGYGASFALKSDGTVVGWGDNGYGQLNIPAGLSGVIALDVGIYGSVAALKSDGTVVSWGRNSTFGGVVTGQTAVPVGLGNVVAISEGLNHAVALKSDGTIVAWGLDTVFSDTNSNNINLVPPGISGVVAVSAGTDRTFVMKADGSVVWWGHLGATAPYMVNGQPYQTAQGYGIAVPAPNGVSGVSAGFAFTSTYTGREGTTYSLSSTAPTNPGNYSVTVTGTAAAFSSSKTINFTISKATPTVSALPTATAINYGQTLASSSLSGGTINFGGASISGSFSFVDGTIAPSAGNNIQNVIFTPVTSSLFNSVMVSIPVQVNKVTPVLVNAPVASTITFGQTLASSTLGDGIASVPGSFGFTNGSNAPNAGNASQDVTFTPTDTSNYNSFTTTINVLVAKANPSVTAVPTASSINYGQTLSSSILGGGVASVPGAFAFVDSAIVPAVGTTNQNIVFTPADASNYNSVTVSGTVFTRSFGTANDSGFAGEAGGIANAVQGFSAVGNVISNDPNYAGSNLALSGVSNSGGSGSIGTALAGAYGSLTIQSNGDYVYTVANSNPIVEALQQNATLSDTFYYAVTDGVFTETGTLVVTINGANDAPSFSSLAGGTTKQGVEDTEVVITLADVHGLANS